MKKHHGFTLIEILIALSVFAILAAVTSSSMYYAFNARARVSAQADRLNALQLTIALLQQDTQEIATRSIHANELYFFPALIGRKDYIEFIRGGLPNPNGTEKRSTLKRIAWLCKSNQLIRRSWAVLDPPSRDSYEDKILLRQLQDCHFAFLDTSLQILNEWRMNSMQTASSSKMLPKAIQLNIALPDWGTGTFLLIIPEVLYEHV